MNPFVNPQRKEEERQDQVMTRQENFQRETEVMQTALSDTDQINTPRENTDLTRWQQDLSPEMELLVRRLQRKKYNTHTGTWERITINGQPLLPMMNELGIQDTISTLEFNMNRNLMMSNLDEKEANRKIMNAIINYIFLLAQNLNRWGIDKRDLDSITQIYEDAIVPTHFRAYRNGERSYLNTINRRVEAQTINNSQAQNNNKTFLGIPVNGG